MVAPGALTLMTLVSPDGVLSGISPPGAGPYVPARASEASVLTAAHIQPAVLFRALNMMGSGRIQPYVSSEPSKMAALGGTRECGGMADRIFRGRVGSVRNMTSPRERWAHSSVVGSER